MIGQLSSSCCRAEVDVDFVLHRDLTAEARFWCTRCEKWSATAVRAAPRPVPVRIRGISARPDARAQEVLA